MRCVKCSVRMTKLNMLLGHASLSKYLGLTLCILMDFPIHIDTISMGLPIVYFKGSRVDVSKF